LKKTFAFAEAMANERSRSATPSRAPAKSFPQGLPLQWKTGDRSIEQKQVPAGLQLQKKINENDNFNIKSMKKIGIIGGLGPEATIDYYKEIIKGFNAINGETSLDYPEILIYSVNMSKFIGMLEVEAYEKATDYMVNCLSSLAKAGADFAVLSANTPHLLFHEIEKRSNLPLISIVNVCAQKAKSMGIAKCGLLGTKFTMKNRFYADVFENFGIGTVVPEAHEIEWLNQKLFSELEVGIFKEETKNEILTLVRTMKQRSQIDGLILGCTEFPIMFRESSYEGMHFLNTTQIHVSAIIEECINNNQ
jgi:aspartate racemase